MEKEQDGVWRTIRGRRVFIREGESLGSAMSRSGKFNRSDIRESKNDVSIKDRLERRDKHNFSNKKNTKEYHKMVKKNYNSLPSQVERQDQKNRIHPTISQNNGYTAGNTRIERNYNRYSDTDKRELRHEELKRQLENYKKIKYDYSLADKSLKDVEKAKKELADFKAKKQSNNKLTTGDKLTFEHNQKQIDSDKTSKEYRKELIKENQEILNKTKKEEMIGNIPKKSYDIADQINKDFEGKDHISREEFDNYLTGKYDDEDADIRGIMSYQGWETKYESDDRANEGDLVRDLPKKSEKKYDPSGLNSKEDYEHDLKWFEDMEKKYPTKEGLAKNEDYQTLKEQYESEYNTKWKSKDDTIKAFKEKKQSNNKVKTNPLIENDKKVNQKTLKEYAKYGLATDISNYDDKQLDKLLKKHGKLEHLKTSHGVYGQNGALFKSGKTGEYFVLTNRSGNWYRLV